MAAHHAGKTPALGGADHVHKPGLGEDVHQHPVAGLGGHNAFGVELQSHFLDDLHRRRFGLGEVPGLRLGHILVLDELDQADLRGLVAVLGQRLQLRNHAGAGLQHRNRVHVALFVEDLRHADLFTQNSRNCHVFLASSCDVEFIALPGPSRAANVLKFCAAVSLLRRKARLAAPQVPTSQTP